MSDIDGVQRAYEETYEETREETQEVPVLFLHQIERHYRQGEAVLHILKGAELAVWAGQSVALVAPSGSGKSTLLHLAGLLEHPDHGDVYINGTPTAELSDGERTRLRREQVGFVYQSHHLLPEFSALENVMLPQMIRGLPRAEARRRAGELLGYLGLGARVSHRPAELSGGEQQRVAIARAIVSDPEIVVGDEPTGDLDAKNAEDILGLLRTLKEEFGKTVVIVTHDPRAVKYVDEVVHLDKGVVTGREPGGAAM